MCKLENFFNRLNYSSVINCKNKNDFFQTNHHFIINANKILEKLSSALKKAIAKDILTPEEKKLLFNSEKQEESKSKKSTDKATHEKDEEIKRLKIALEGISFLLNIDIICFL